jgi:hypothetical protein
MYLLVVGVIDALVGHPSEAHFAPAHVTSDDISSKLYVNPWELEYGPNPVLYPHLRAPQRHVKTRGVPRTSNAIRDTSLMAVPESNPILSPVLASDPNLTPIPASSPILSPAVGRSPTSSLSFELSIASAPLPISTVSVKPGVDNISPPSPDQSAGPYELDAADHISRYRFDSPMLMVGRVPYRWEQTTGVGVNRMFFEADQDILPFGLKRKPSQEAMSPRQRLSYTGRTASLGSWQESDGMGFATGMSIGVDQDLCFIDPWSARESSFCASDSALQNDDRSCWDGSYRSSLCEKQLMPDQPAPVDSGPSCVLEQRRRLMNDSQQRFFFNAVAALHAQQDELHARFGVASPTLRGNIELDGSSSASHNSAQSPSSLRSSCSSLVPETPRTPATSSTFFATQTKQSNSDFSTVSSATTVSVDYGGYDCPDCGAAFQTLGKMRFVLC